MEIEMHVEEMNVTSNGADHVVATARLDRSAFIELVKMTIATGEITLKEISQ